MIVYLTIGEQPSGIFLGQVIDVVQFMQTNLQRKVKLVAFISGRDFFKNRKKIRRLSPGAIVLPMLPGLARWKKNRFVLYAICLMLRPHTIIARNILAAKLALFARNKKLARRAVLDGRGAIAAEWHEYEVVQEASLKENIFAWEKEAVLESDAQIAVSKRLIAYWERSFGFKKNTAVVIPCTINQVFLNLQIEADTIAAQRAAMGIDKDAILLVYSGSIAGWQSFSLLGAFLEQIMKSHAKVVLYFLSSKTREVVQLMETYPGRVLQNQVPPEQVGRHLMICDYGLLIRERNTTNEVASPVKFAEYLAAGLNVIISDGIGDYPEFVKTHGCGYVLDHQAVDLCNTGLEARLRNRRLALEHFTKEKYIEQYTKIAGSTVS